MVIDVHSKTFTLKPPFSSWSFLAWPLPSYIHAKLQKQIKLNLHFLYPLWDKHSQHDTSVHCILDWVLHIAKMVSTGLEM